MDISIIEFIVYGLVGYTGVVLLVISAFRDTPISRSQSLVRAIYLTLSVISVFILANSGLDINMENINTTSTTINLNTTETWSETIITTSNFTLVNPIWITFHVLLGLIMIFYIILQVLTLFSKAE